MKNYKLLILILIIIGQSCTKIQHDYVNEYQVNIHNVSLKKLELDTLPLYPQKCCFVDSFFVVKKGMENKNIISIYYQNKLYKEFLNIGNSNNELISPELNSEGKVSKRFLEILDLGKVRKYDFSTIDNSELLYEDFLLPDELRLTNFLAVNNDSIFIVNNTSEYQLTKYNKLNQKQNHYSNIEKFFGNKITDFIYLNQIYISVKNSCNNYIILAYIKYKMIDIYSLNGDLIKRIYFENFDYNNQNCDFVDYNGLLNVKYNKNSLLYFSSIITADNCFYAICLNDKEEHIKEGLTQSIMYKFDYNGNLLDKYLFDMTITSGVINQDTIYAIGHKPNQEQELFYGKL